jgi:hypothetical protein
MRRTFYTFEVPLVTSRRLDVNVSSNFFGRMHPSLCRTASRDSRNQEQPPTQRLTPQHRTLRLLYRPSTIFRQVPVTPAKSRRNPSHQATKLAHERMRYDPHRMIEQRNAPLRLRIRDLRRPRDEFLDLFDKRTSYCVVSRERSWDVLL